MYTSIAVCIASFFVLLYFLRRRAVSFGLPLAYLYSLLLIHVPGAYAVMETGQYTKDIVATGIYYTAIGAVSFVAAVIVTDLLLSPPPAPVPAGRTGFAIFCLAAGWLVNYGLGFLQSIPSLGAAVDKTGALWMLGVMLGLRMSLRRGNLLRTLLWGSAMLVYPLLMLVLGGFLSYGSAAIIIVLAVLLIYTRSAILVAAGLLVGTYLSMSIFVNYFQHRDAIRAEAWGGGSLEQKIDAVLAVASEFEPLSLDNPYQVFAITERLNQNYFVGLAARRIDQGAVSYLYGRSLWEGLIALVPRAFWPEKPVMAGSPKIVSEMTGLRLNADTSFGVGNVMEFQINFGMAGVIGGFAIFGFILRIMDRKAAEADHKGNFASLIMWFLPAVALIQPNGSVVELASGAAAATIGAFAWKWLWRECSKMGRGRRRLRYSCRGASSQSLHSVPANRVSGPI